MELDLNFSELRLIPENSSTEDCEFNSPAKARAEELVRHIDDLILDLCIETEQPSTHEENLKRVLETAANYDDYLRVFRQRAAVAATAFVPQVIQSVGEKAIMGDLKASKLVLDVAGVLSKDKTNDSSLRPVFQQVNIDARQVKLRDLLEADYEVEYEK